MPTRIIKHGQNDQSARTEMLERELGSLRRDLETLRNRPQLPQAAPNILPTLISCAAILVALFALIRR